jgi:hypothetical protein
MCYPHPRVLSPISISLHNNCFNLVLSSRIARALEHAPHQTDFKAKHHDWFRKSRKPTIDADSLTIYKYALVALPESTFDATKTFERFASAGAW